MKYIGITALTIGIILYLAGGTLKTFRPELSGIFWIASLAVLKRPFHPNSSDEPFH